MADKLRQVELRGQVLGISRAMARVGGIDRSGSRVPLDVHRGPVGPISDQWALPNLVPHNSLYY